MADEMRDQAGVRLHVAVVPASQLDSDTTLACYDGIQKGVHRIRVLRRYYRADPDVLRAILFHELIHADQAERIGWRPFLKDYLDRMAPSYDLPWERNDYEYEAWDRTVDRFPGLGLSKYAHLKRYDDVPDRRKLFKN